MTSPPDRRSSGGRWTDIDWARGIAVLIMIQAHILDSWTSARDHASPVYRYLDIVNGFAAPMFLWLAGVALVLAGERTLRSTGSRRRACLGLAMRGVEIFILAFVFRLQSFVFNLGGDPITILRVDILNVMGVAMVVTAAIWSATRTRTAQVAGLATAAAAVALVTPIVTAAAWVDALPDWGQWYVRPAGEHTVFTLLPWAGFVFGGAAAGSALAAAGEARSRDRLQVVLAAVGLFILSLGAFTAALPTIYGHSSFWTTSPTFFAIRVGILLLAGAALHALARLGAGRGVECRPLQTLGRASLFVYWVHVQVVYGWITWPLHHRLTIGQAMWAVAVLSAVMYMLIPVWNRAIGVWQGRNGAQRGPEKVSGEVVASV